MSYDFCAYGERIVDLDTHYLDCHGCAMSSVEHLRAEVARLSTIVRQYEDTIIPDWQRDLDRIERERDEALREVRYLRTYGNKDCTAQADAAMAVGEFHAARGNSDE